MNDAEWTAADDAVEEIREVRRQLWEQFDNDPTKYTAFLQEVGQQLIRDGWAKEAPAPKRDKSAA